MAKHIGSAPIISQIAWRMCKGRCFGSRRNGTAIARVTTTERNLSFPRGACSKQLADDRVRTTLHCGTPSTDSSYRANARTFVRDRQATTRSPLADQLLLHLVHVQIRSGLRVICRAFFKHCWSGTFALHWEPSDQHPLRASHICISSTRRRSQPRNAPYGGKQPGPNTARARAVLKQ